MQVMYPPGGGESIKVHLSQTETMKKRGWTKTKPSKKTKEVKSNG